MAKLAWAGPALVAVIGTWGCGSDVPIGQGQNNQTGTGGTAGSSGSSGNAGSSASGGSGGSSASGGSGGSAASGGSAGSGASAGVGGASGAGGSGGTSGGGGSGGGTGVCPTFEQKILSHIPAPNARDVLMVGTKAYWSATSVTPGGLYSVDLPSGTPVTLGDATMYSAQADAFDAPDSMATDGTNLYWRAKEGAGIWRMPLAGGTPVQVSSVVPSITPGTQGGAQSILALNGSQVFWLQGPTPIATQDVQFDIYSAPMAGGASTKIASFQSSSADPSKPFQPLSIKADATSLFFSLTAAGSAKLLRSGLDGSNQTDLFGAGGWLALDGSSVLVTESAFAWNIPKAGGSPTALTQGLDPNDVFAIDQGIAVSGGNVYLTSLGTTVSSGLDCCTCGWVLSVPETANMTSPNVLWSGKGRPTSVAIGGAFLVTVDIDNGELLVLSP